MRHAIAIGSLVLLAAAFGCGGSDKKVEEPQNADDDSADEPAETGDDMIDPEIFDNIRRTFERKQTIVGRCFADGVESGELKKTDRGYVTVVATVNPDGKASDIAISEATLKSPTLHKCVTDMVATWVFPNPPKPIKQSFTYVMEQL